MRAAARPRKAHHRQACARRVPDRRVISGNSRPLTDRPAGTLTCGGAGRGIAPTIFAGRGSGPGHQRHLRSGRPCGDHRPRHPDRCPALRQHRPGQPPAVPPQRRSTPRRRSKHPPRPGGIQSHPPHTGGSLIDSYPWHLTLDEAERLLSTAQPPDSSTSTSSQQPAACSSVISSRSNATSVPARHAVWCPFARSPIG